MVHSNLIDFSREFLDTIAACKFAGGTFLDLILLLLLITRTTNIVGIVN